MSDDYFMGNLLCKHPNEPFSQTKRALKKKTRPLISPHPLHYIFCAAGQPPAFDGRSYPSGS